MLCDPHFTISLFGMLFFAGWACSSLIIPTLADKYGRKKVLIPCIFANIIIFIVPLVLPANHEMIYIVHFIQFLNGFKNGGLIPIGYAYMMEMFPDRSQIFYGTLWNITDGSTFLTLTLFWRFIVQSWMWTFYAGITF